MDAELICNLNPFTGRITPRAGGSACGGKLEMGILGDAPATPDTFGLCEYFVTDIAVETAGSNVRMICGVRRGGQIHWLYSCVMPAELLIPASQDCARAACESFNLLQMLEGRGKGH